MDHYLTFLQLLELPCTPLPPSPLHKDYLNPLKNVTASAKQNFGQGCCKPGGGASAPLAPPLFIYLFIYYGFTAQVLKVCRAPGPTAC